MQITKAQRAKIITTKELEHITYSVPKGWYKAAGILSGKKHIDPLCYQKEIRKEWKSRLKKHDH